MAFNASLSLRLLVSAVDSMGGSFSVGGAPIELSTTDGTEANEADIAYSARRTVADSLTPDTIDLAGGGLIGVSRAVISFVEVVGLLFRNRSDTATLTLGGNANGPAWLPENDIPPGGVVLLWCSADPAWAVTAGTGDIIEVASDDAVHPHEYDIIILGRSA